MKTTQAHIDEQNRVISEAAKCGCEYKEFGRDPWTGDFNWHKVHAFRDGKIYKVHVSPGQPVKSAVDMQIEAIKQIKGMPPLVSTGPSGIGGYAQDELTAADMAEIIKSYKPLFRSHSLVGMVKRLFRW